VREKWGREIENAQHAMYSDFLPGDIKIMASGAIIKKLDRHDDHDEYFDESRFGKLDMSTRKHVFREIIATSIAKHGSLEKDVVLMKSIKNARFPGATSFDTGRKNPGMEWMFDTIADAAPVDVGLVACGKISFYNSFFQNYYLDYNHAHLANRIVDMEQPVMKSKDRVRLVKALYCALDKLDKVDDYHAKQGIIDRSMFRETIVKALDTRSRSAKRTMYHREAFDIISKDLGANRGARSTRGT
jgi:hypothetical protein